FRAEQTLTHLLPCPAECFPGLSHHFPLLCVCVCVCVLPHTYLTMLSAVLFPLYTPFSPFLLTSLSPLAPPLSLSLFLCPSLSPSVPLSLPLSLSLSLCSSLSLSLSL